MESFGKVIGGIAIFLVSLLIIGGLFMGGREVGWWFKNDNTNRSTKLEDKSYSRQTAIVDQVLNDYKEITRIDVAIASSDPATKQAFVGQRVAIVTDMCDAVGRLTGTVSLSPGAEALISQECL